MGQYNRLTTANASENNGNNNNNNNNNNNTGSGSGSGNTGSYNSNPYYSNNTNGHNYGNTNKHHYRSTSDIAANINLGTPNGGTFHQSLYQSSPPPALHATPIPQPPQHPLMSLPPPITSAMNSQAKPPHASIGNVYNTNHNQSSNGNHYHNDHNNNINDSFTLRASPHFQMLEHNRTQSYRSGPQDYTHPPQYGGGTDAAFDHVPQSHVNGLPLSQPKPTLPYLHITKRNHSNNNHLSNNNHNNNNYSSTIMLLPLFNNNPLRADLIHCCTIWVSNHNQVRNLYVNSCTILTQTMPLISNLSKI